MRPAAAAVNFGAGEASLHKSGRGGYSSGVKFTVSPGEAEARYRKIFEAAEVGLWEEDYSAVRQELLRLRRAGVTEFQDYFLQHPGEVPRLRALIRVLDANSQALKFHGARSLTQLDGSLEGISVPEALPVFREALTAIAEDRDFFESEVQGRTLQGEVVYSVVRFAIPREEAQFKRVIVSTVDITRRKQAELALYESEARYRKIFENAKVSLWENDFSGAFQAVEDLKRGGVSDFRSYLRENPGFVRECLGMIRIIDVNRETLRLYKASDKEQLLGPLTSFIHEDALGAYADELLALAEGREHFEGEQPDRTFAGERMQILVSYSVPRTLEEARRVVVSVTDITARRRAEEEQLKIQRLESLGVLAGGIAHDFNNLLTAILGNLSLLQAGGEKEQVLAETKKAIARARGLTEQLLTFSRGGAPVKKLVALDKLLRETVPFALAGSNVQVVFDLASDLLEAELDEGQFAQVINNLVINARQAMPKGGRLEVQAANGGTEAGRRTVRITFRDHGEGIPEAHLPRIFDPYFSTKKDGKGLGLTVVYSIVRSHDGRVEVDSRPGQGAAFTLHLPASDRRGPSAATEPLRELKGLRVLIMDDEEPIRKVAGRMLQRLGCTVFEAADGVEALSLYKQWQRAGNPPDVLIMDLTVPGGMGGLEALRRLRALNPQVRAVVSSGYSNDPVLASPRDHGFRGVLSKPYTLEEIQRVLGELAREP
jgi:signal transduction histidine kinase/ActR/RegA family two-component response regulator